MERKPPEGVMDAAYAADRARKPHLAFRYRTRAMVVRDAVRDVLGRTSGLDGLDFGCAEGRTLAELSRLLPDSRFVGIEYAQALLDCAPAMPAGIELRRGDVLALDDDLRARRFDFVSALALLEHLDDPSTAVRQAAEVLRPGGVFVATCPNPLWDKIAGRLGLVADEHHAADMDRRALAAAVESAGLEFVSYDRFMFAPVGFVPYLRVPVAPRAALAVDRAVGALKLLDWAFVNQRIVAHKAG